MATNDTRAKKERNRFWGTVPKELEDERAEIRKRGYDDSDIFAEGVRCLSEKWGLMSKGRGLEMDMHIQGPVQSVVKPSPAGQGSG